MRTTAAVLMGAALLTACSAAPAAEQAGPTATPVAEAGVAAPVATGEQPVGVTYDVKRVPPGARLAVTSKVENGSTTVELTVRGLLPNAKYGSHVHTKPCGGKPADSGPHYQDDKDPVSPSVNSRYANIDNEIWLDLTTDAAGSGSGRATVRWEFREGEARAVVLHAAHTSTELGKAGTAGDRLACLTARF